MAPKTPHETAIKNLIIIFDAGPLNVTEQNSFSFIKTAYGIFFNILTRNPLLVSQEIPMHSH